MWPFNKRKKSTASHDNIVERFLSGLREHLSEDDRMQLSFAFGADSKQLKNLQHRYPRCPDTLVQLLRSINGTYWQQYGDHQICVLILGSDIHKYPYYLKSVEQILEGSGLNSSIRELYADYLNDDPGLVGKGIDPDIKLDRWLCFSDCMNNGGTSQLYLDFNPSPEGVRGQVVRYLHDPDSFKVIANSFDEYLQQLIDGGYSYTTPDE